MREIKFKYVVKAENEQHEAILVSKTYTLEEIENSCDIIDTLMEDLSNECSDATCKINGYCECGSDFDGMEFKIIARLQYTGLKDKNGVEIYEGDYVKISDFTGKPYNNEKAVIIFYGNAWCKDMSEFYPSARGGWCETIKGDETYQYFEVIGNIYENTKL